VLSKNPAFKVTIVAKHMPGDYDAEYASPWAGANYLPSVSPLTRARAKGSEPQFTHDDIEYRVSNRGTDAAEWDKNTWYELYRLARDVPEAGIHVQGINPLNIVRWSKGGTLIEQNTGSADTIIYNRMKDASKATADWFSGLLSTDPWFKDVVPNVCDSVQLARTNRWLIPPQSSR